MQYYERGAGLVAVCPLDAFPRHRSALDGAVRQGGAAAAARAARVRRAAAAHGQACQRSCARQEARAPALRGRAAWHCAGQGKRRQRRCAHGHRDLHRLYLPYICPISPRYLPATATATSIASASTTATATATRPPSPPMRQVTRQDYALIEYANGSAVEVHTPSLAQTQHGEWLAVRAALEITASESAAISPLYLHYISPISPGVRVRRGANANPDPTPYPDLTLPLTLT